MDGINENVRQSLQSDWLFVVKKLRAMITKKPQKHLASMHYNFGKERVELHSQSFASFQLNYLICLCMFGKDLSKVKKSELVYQSKRVTVIHLSSIDRAKSLLNIDGLSGATFEEDNYKFSASPKVSLLCHGRSISGYVLSRTNNELIIRTTNNDIIHCRAPKWIEGENKYQYYPQEVGTYVQEFWPICFAVSTSLEVKITLHRFTVDVVSGNVV